jgi:hypothetical protein
MGQQIVLVGGLGTGETHIGLVAKISAGRDYPLTGSCKTACLVVFDVSGSVFSVKGIADVSVGVRAGPSLVGLQPYRAAWAISFGNLTSLQAAMANPKTVATFALPRTLTLAKPACTLIQPKTGLAAKIFAGRDYPQKVGIVECH